MPGRSSLQESVDVAIQELVRAQALRHPLGHSIDPAASGREAHAVYGRDLVQVQLLDVTADEQRSVLGAGAIEDGVEATRGLARLLVAIGGRCDAIDVRREADDCSDLVPARLVARDAEGDPRHETAEAAGVAQLSETAEDPQEDLLEQILLVGRGPEEPAQQSDG
ncbi:MAG TPA: hypothetical protein VHO06_11070 [Polyangia bacterium]|nr:hypothetical protein [Polyangia bacterium]